MDYGACTALVATAHSPYVWTSCLSDCLLYTIAVSHVEDEMLMSGGWWFGEGLREIQ